MPGQGGHLGLGDIRVVANTALTGAAHVAVHDTEPVEGSRGAIVHIDGETYVDGTFGVDQEVDDPFLDTVDPSQGPFELLGSVNEKVETLDGFDRHIHHSPRRI